MPRRSVPLDPSVGERIRARREMRRWSIRHAASRAGIAHTTWSRIERGELRADRYMLIDLAAALECSAADLTGQQQVPGDRALAAAHSRAVGIWRALVDIAPDEPAQREPLVPLDVLAKRVEQVDGLRRACDYAGVGQVLPDLLADLHAVVTAGRDTRTALRQLMEATYVAMFTLRNLGYVAECALAAERCRQAAERLDQVVPLAVSDWVGAHAASAAGSIRRSITLTTRAADQLVGRLSESAAPEVLGMVHLTSAVSALADHRPGDAFAHVGEAEAIAERTGETQSWSMSFGPTNVGIWRMGVEVDAGEPGRAVEIGQAINPAILPSMARQSTYYVEFARALTDIKRDRDAVRMLLHAERLAPQRIRSSVSAREAVRFLLNRARRQAGGSALRGLCERMAVAT